MPAPTPRIRRLTDLIREQITAGYYNIDVDASTVVNLSHPTLMEQQRLNAELTARFTRIVREMEPPGVTISIGAEIGEVGAHNTTPDELGAFMATYRPTLDAAGGGVGVGKISVNTGTRHGGLVLPDGTLAEVSRVARKEFGLSGAVQHGASTLPINVFSRFPESETVEIQLAFGSTTSTSTIRASPRWRNSSRRMAAWTSPKRLPDPFNAFTEGACRRSRRRVGTLSM